MSEKITVSFEIDPSKLKDGAMWCSPLSTIRKNGYEIHNLNAAAYVTKLPPGKTPPKFEGGIEAEFFPSKSWIKYETIGLVRIEGEVYGVHGTDLSFHEKAVDSFNDGLKCRGYSREERRDIFKRWFTTTKEAPVKGEPGIFETEVDKFKLKFEEVYYSPEFIKNLPKPLTKGKLIVGRRGVRLTVTPGVPRPLIVHYYSICNPCDTFSFRKGVETALATTDPDYVINDGAWMRFTQPHKSNFHQVMREYDNFVKNGGGKQ